eukprot:6283358-Amphidinium_carterae.1
MLVVPCPPAGPPLPHVSRSSMQLHILVVCYDGVLEHASYLLNSTRSDGKQLQANKSNAPPFPRPKMWGMNQ